MDIRDVVTLSAMISGYSQARKCKEVLDVFRDMQMAKVEPNEVTLVSVLSSCDVLGALETGKWVHFYVKKKRMELTVTLGTVLMDFYAKCGLMESANEVFNKMPFKNVLSWTVLIQGLTNNGQRKRALDFYALMCKKAIHGYGVKTESGIGFYSSASPALLTIYTKRGRIQDAKKSKALGDASSVIRQIVSTLGLGFENVKIKLEGDVDGK
ncbi:hypothetical protein QYF36_025009 [Acer negundo]|nr:hypothetical protein QYF36_025009 [Acer negundo]